MVVIRLTIILLATAAIGNLFVFAYVYRVTRNRAKVVLKQNVDDVCEDMDDTIRENMNRSAKMLSTRFTLDQEAGYSQETLREYTKLNFFSEITIVDDAGIVVGSSDSALVGFDMASKEESAEFLCLLQGETMYFSYHVPLEDISGKNMFYAGAPLEGGGFILIGMDEECVWDYVMTNLGSLVSNRHIGEHGFLLICDQDSVIMGSYDNQYNGEKLGIELHPGEGMEYSRFREIPSLILTEAIGLNLVVGVSPVKDFTDSTYNTMKVVVLLFAFIALVLGFALSMQMRKLVVNGIVSLNHTLSQIAAGNLEEKADVRTSLEFSSLSDDINVTVEAMKGFIAREAARIDQDLAVAKEIQLSNLPSVFPPFPDRDEFNLFASMDAAKEVGGDFYDFYLLGENTLAFLVADVSGKGIPGAMCMMSGKSVIRGFAESGEKPADIFSHANDKLYANNEAGMFITVWMGFLDIRSGLVRFVNAGHNPPVLIRGNKAEYIQQKASMILGVFEGVPYKEQTLQLMPGDMLFLYTDGVPEAINEEEEQYGEERLLAVLSEPAEAGGDICRDTCVRVREDVRRFVGGAEQFDDITTVCLYYTGGKAIKVNIDGSGKRV